MKHKFLLLFICLSKFCFAQNDAKDVEFIKAVVDNSHFYGKGFYTDRFSPQQIAEMKKMLGKDTIYNNNWVKRDHSYIVFSKPEKEFINDELEKLKDFKWKEGLIPNLKMISSDTVQNIFNDTKKWWGYFYKNYGSYFYQFSKPIFLRNNTVCIFYKTYSCGGLCGQGDFIIYVLKDNTWTEQYYVSGWIS